MKRFALFACICWVGLGLLTDTLAEAQHADSDAALDTIAIINQINYAVEVIRTYNNVIALEEEYEKISADNLNLNCIRDEESLQLIRDILNTLNSMRMNDRARKWYRHVLTRDLKGAKINGMAKMATTVTSSLANLSRFADTAIDPPFATSSATSKTSILFASEIVLTRPLTISALGLLASTMVTTINATSAAAPADPPMIRTLFFLSITSPS